MNPARRITDDFRRFRDSGMRAGSTKRIGTACVTARNALARRLIRSGVRPNHVTVVGFLASCGAAACFMAGAGHHAAWEPAVPGAAQSTWPLWAAAWLFVAGACDLLDGAVARLGNLGTEFGGVLDSILDRLSDMVLYLGIAIHFAASGNVTYVALAVIALCNGLLISYTKARAEEHVADGGVGFWQRGERSGAILLAALSCHVPIMLWQQAVFPFFTFLLRARFARAAIRANQAGRPPPPTLPARHGANLLRPWRYPRGTIPYDLTVGINIALIVALPWVYAALHGAADPLGDWLVTGLGPAVSSPS